MALSFHVRPTTHIDSATLVRTVLALVRLWAQCHAPPQQTLPLRSPGPQLPPPLPPRLLPLAFLPLPLRARSVSQALCRTVWWFPTIFLRRTSTTLPHFFIFKSTSCQGLLCRSS